MRKATLPLLAGGLMFFAAAHGAGAQTSNPGLTPPPPPPPVGGTVVPPPAPGATATPLPTVVPLTLSVRLSRGTVGPGQKQTVNVLTTPGARIQVIVRFPNGYEKKHGATAGLAGKMTWTYVQPGSRVTHASRVAKVFTRVTKGTALTKDTRHYTVAFGVIDISINPHAQKPGRSVTIWVHTYPNASVRVVFARGSHAVKTLPLRTGSAGWLQLRYVVPTHFSPGKLDVAASVSHGKRGTTARASFTIT